MERVTITIDSDLLGAVDALMHRRGYASRSEALRDIVRDFVSRDATEAPDTACVATLTYVYDHETRELAQRLTNAQHDRHDLGVASLHVHLDHHACLEVAVLRGSSGDVRHFADRLTAQRGVRHARLHLMPVIEAEETHSHHDGAPAHRHHSA